MKIVNYALLLLTQILLKFEKSILEAIKWLINKLIRKLDEKTNIFNTWFVINCRN